jgi:hypothetical protein
MMEFIPVGISPGTPTYSAIRGDFTFVITYINGKFHATAKKRGGKPFDGTIVELGYHKHFQDAAQVCDRYWWKHSQ